MTKAIQKRSAIVSKKQAALEQFAQAEMKKTGHYIQVGDKFMDKDGRVITVESFDKDFRWIQYDKDGVKTGSDDRRKEYFTVIKCFYYYDWDREEGEEYSETEENKSHTTFTFADLESGAIARMAKTEAEYDKEALDMIVNDTMPDTGNYENVNTDTALIQVNGSESLTILKKDMLAKRDHIAILKRTIESIMKSKVDALYNKMSLMKKTIERVSKVIHTIELYMGINEDIVQIAEGIKASEKEPICIRQQLLYMDEEVGDPEDNGLDFQKIEQFDNWLSTHYKLCIPENKCIVAFRVRRNDKDYGEINPWVKMQMDTENMKTYFVIRNGENVYRIWADLRINDRLYPKKSELDNLLKEYEKTHWNSDKDRIEHGFFKYKQQGIVLQGLVDRSDILHPLPAPYIKLADDDSVIKGYVRYIGDDELALPDGHLEFWDWHKKINENIAEGSRVLLVSKHIKISRKHGEDRFLRYYNEYNVPPKPKTGVYLVETVNREEMRDIEIKIYNTHKDWIKIVSDKHPKYKTRQFPWRNPEDFVKPEYCDYHSNDPLEDRPVYINVPNHKKYKWVICNIRNKDKKSHNYERELHKWKELVIKYNPKDEVRTNWYYDYHERKNRLTFMIDPFEQGIFNYDGIDLAQVEYYLNSRINRRHYLSMMPVLVELKKMRLEELKQEKEFAKLTTGEIMKALNMQDGFQGIYLRVMEAVEWWKLKNKWKRPINKDDSKAMRMIKKRLLKEFKLPDTENE